MTIIVKGYPGTVDADGICASQTPTGAGALTIDGVLKDGAIANCGRGYAPGVTITSASNLSARTFTITGTSVNSTTGLRTEGDTEAITGPNATTVTSTKYWEKVTSITVDAATGAALTVGVNATSVFATTSMLEGSLYQVLFGGTFGSGTVQLKVYDEELAESINLGDSVTAAGIQNMEIPIGTKVRASISGATNPTINIIAKPINKVH